MTASWRSERGAEAAARGRGGGRRGAAGFSLAELAVVLLILVVLVGGVVSPLTAQIEQRRREETVRALAEIREALIGFAIINGRLPCPAYATDPANALYGVESFPCSSGVVTEGFLPWRTLGVAGFDAWGSPRTATGDPNKGHWRYRVDRNFVQTGAARISLTTSYGTSLDVRSPGGAARLNTDAERPLAIVFSTGSNRSADLDNDPAYVLPGAPPPGYVAAQTYNAGELTTGFDDITIWIGRPQLYARMVAAGVLP